MIMQANELLQSAKKPNFPPKPKNRKWNISQRKKLKNPERAINPGLKKKFGNVIPPIELTMKTSSCLLKKSA